MRIELKCGCAWTPQPDVDYRPFLEEPVGERHLARWVRGATWKVVTWCDQTVPADHRCPTGAELRDQGVDVPTFCSACARAWEARTRQAC